VGLRGLRLAGVLLLVGGLALVAYAFVLFRGGLDLSGQVLGHRAEKVRPPASDASWRLVEYDDFNGHRLSSARWGVYRGVPGCCPGTLWDPGQVRVSDGVLHLVNSRNADGRWLSAGISNARGLVQTYGRYLVRAKVDKGKGVGASALLWPYRHPWPPEVDFMETFPGDPQRQTQSVTVHWAGGRPQLSRRQLPLDMSKWHVYGVEWLPGILRYTVDGRLVATQRGFGRVPVVPTWLALQTAVRACPGPCPDASTPAHVNLDVDWVAAYQPKTLPADKRRPVVRFAPLPTSVLTGRVTARAGARDDRRVAVVELVADGKKVLARDATAPYNLTWDTHLLPNGEHQLQMRVYDAAGNLRMSAGRTVDIANIDSVPPTVTITAPPANDTTVSGLVNVAATAADDMAVARVEFYVDGVLRRSDPTPQYSFAWPTATFAPGPHIIAVRAVDTSGNVSLIAQRTLTVH
jgi:hypothetical protein